MRSAGSGILVLAAAQVNTKPTEAEAYADYGQRNTGTFTTGASADSGVRNGVFSYYREFNQNIWDNSRPKTWLAGPVKLEKTPAYLLLVGRESLK